MSPLRTSLATAKRHRPKTPVILVSGFAPGEDVVDAARRGAFRVLRKPFPPRVLLDVDEGGPPGPIGRPR